jgi:hypothetical protein
MMKTGYSVLQLFRSLFPYWKFFDRYGYVPRLYFRFQADSVWSEWADFHPQVKYTWFQLFHNPEVNLIHWEQSLLSQLVDDTKDCPPHQVEHLESYLWVKELVIERTASQKPHHVQFEIRGRTFVEDKMVEESWMISPEHELGTQS